MYWEEQWKIGIVFTKWFRVWSATMKMATLKIFSVRFLVYNRRHPILSHRMPFYLTLLSLFPFYLISDHWLSLQYVCFPIRARYPVPPKRRCLLTRILDTTSHDAVIFKLRTDYIWSLFASFRLKVLCLLSTVKDSEDRRTVFAIWLTSVLDGVLRLRFCVLQNFENWECFDLYLETE